MNPYYNVGKSSSLVLSASSIVTIRGKGDAKEEAFSVVSLVYLGLPDRRVGAQQSQKGWANKHTPFNIDRNIARSGKNRLPK